jgi:hypothetical protein
LIFDLPANRLFWHISGGYFGRNVFDERFTETNGFNKQSKRLQVP